MEIDEKERNKNYRSVPTRYVMENSKQIAKKFKKLKKKYRCGFISSENRQKKAAKERKQKLSFRSFLTRGVKDNSKKMAKKFKNTNMASL